MRALLSSTKVLTLCLTLSTAAVGLIPATHAQAASTDTAATRPDSKKLKMHLAEHQAYPATRAELLAACNDLVDFSAGEKRWFADKLPEGTYKSAAEVMKALRIK